MYRLRIRERMRSLVTASALLAATLPLPAATINAVADTYLQSPSPDLAAGSEQTIALESATTKPGLVRFDLTGYGGQTVTGPATLRFYFASIGLGDTQGNVTLTAFRALVDWNESTTFNSFGPSAGVTGGVDYDTSALGTLPTTFVTLNGAMDIPIPAAILQAWIDDPSSNFGFFVTGNNPRARSREHGLAPQLLFDSILDEDTGNPNDPGPGGGVPEPATAALVGGGLAAAVLLRRGTKR
jgi:hypothetical protein